MKWLLVPRRALSRFAFLLATASMFVAAVGSVEVAAAAPAAQSHLGFGYDSVTFNDDTALEEASSGSDEIGRSRASLARLSAAKPTSPDALRPAADFVAPRTGSGLADDVFGLSDDALEGLTASQRRSVQSLQTNIAEHEAKLASYIDDPFAYDNLGLLANAPTSEIQQAIIQGRIRHLESEISTFADNIRKITRGG
jgi:hypothetical protein